MHLVGAGARFACGTASFLQRHWGASTLRRRDEHRADGRLRSRAPTCMSDDRPSTRPRAQPVRDTATIEAERRACFTSRLWLRAGCHERSTSHADRREVDHRAEMQGKPGASWMIETRCVDEQDVGTLVQRLDCGSEYRAFPTSKQSWRVGVRYSPFDDGLCDDVIGAPWSRIGPRAPEVGIDVAQTRVRRTRPPHDCRRPRPIASAARSCFSRNERHEASSDPERVLGQRPWVGSEDRVGRTRQPVLELDELGICRWPEGSLVLHAPIMRSESPGSPRSASTWVVGTSP